MMNTSLNLLARERALASLPPQLVQQIEPVTFRSRGHLLIIGPEDLGRLAADRLPMMSSITLLANGQISSQDDLHLEQAFNAGQQAKLLYTPLVSLKGWMGQFELQVMTEDQQPLNPAQALIGQPYFDLVLDLSAQPVLAVELPPAGYFARALEAQAPIQALLDQTLIEELQSLQGEFDKPRYIQVNHDLCAHGDRGQVGCQRCLDVCPADALSSQAMPPYHDLTIQVEQSLCHGAGSCATACPTGALSWVQPQPATQLARLRQLLTIYREEGGEQAVVYFYAEDTPPDLAQLPAEVIPCALEEAASVGMDMWMALLTSGARAVAIQLTPDTPPTLRALIEREVRLAGLLLEALGHPAQRISWIEQQGEAPHAADWARLPPEQATWEISDPYPWEGKRATLNAALERLYEQAEAAQPVVALPSGAPFGQVKLAEADCTLCMSCVSICPTQALLGGQTTPELHFNEGSCVQCGLCVAACPEKALTLEARFVVAPGERLEARLLKSEPPFHCIRCAKPFATQSAIHNIMKKLEAHPYFQGEAAQRLQMCEDCRVRDSYLELARDPEAQLRL
ncbi:4Fe-4S binding protein [Marinospirillum sp. MEB164]|uniref:4Fe-4S binding protein n=1 Tax=Marinospirillum alkalitolerans TaxID=3123374 RepID=A0ABW8Q0G7_9GAMM